MNRKISERTDTMEFNDHFREPDSIADAMNRILQLNQELYTIAQQLGDPHRREKFGLNNDDYSMWRLKATHARNTKTLQLEKLNRWIEMQRAKHASQALQTQNPVSIIAELVDIVNNMRQRSHVTITTEEQNILSLASMIVNNEPAK